MKYETVIGFETHVELASRAKVFSTMRASFGGQPNEYVNPVCLGLPGTLPVLNHSSMEMALKVGLALNCTIPEMTIFDRKHYYYPDLPKNYQISQEYQPLGTDGYIMILMPDGTDKKIGIHNLHLEEDAGKNTHATLGGKNISMVDLNRAGTSLLEIVSQPDLRTREECEVFMQTMRSLLRYLEVSDCKMQEGSLRFELNISLRLAGTTEFGTKVEIKNVGSIKSVLRAFDYEKKRQAEILDEGGRVIQETRLWDDDRGETRPMRVKEGAKDYRYFPEPDIPPVMLDRAYLDDLQKHLPELREEKRKRFVSEYGLPEYDAGVLAADKNVAAYFEACCREANEPKVFSNWIMTFILRELKEEDSEISDLPIKPAHLCELQALIARGTINQNIAKQVFKEMISSGKMPATIVKEKGMEAVSDSGQLEGFVDEVITENPGPADEYRSGKDQTINFLLGQVMKKSRGKADPSQVKEIIAQKLRG